MVAHARFELRLARWLSHERSSGACGAVGVSRRACGEPPNKGMKLTKLSAAWLPGWTCRLMPAPAGLDAGTASQLIPGVGRTRWRGSERAEMAEKSPERRLTEFIGRFSPEVARTARSARTKVRKLLPDAFELVYDNYNALAIAFGPTERASDISPLDRALPEVGKPVLRAWSESG